MQRLFEITTDRDKKHQTTEKKVEKILLKHKMVVILHGLLSKN